MTTPSDSSQRAPGPSFIYAPGNRAATPPLKCRAILDLGFQDGAATWGSASIHGALSFEAPFLLPTPFVNVDFPRVTVAADTVDNTNSA